jgi:hypothetical protein
MLFVYLFVRGIGVGQLFVWEGYRCFSCICVLGILMLVVYMCVRGIDVAPVFVC